LATSGRGQVSGFQRHRLSHNFPRVGAKKLTKAKALNSLFEIEAVISKQIIYRLTQIQHNTAINIRTLKIQQQKFIKVCAMCINYAWL